MSFQALCENGSFLEIDTSDVTEGIIVGPSSYRNKLNQLQRTSLGILFFFLAATAIIGNGLALLTVYKRKLQVLYKCCVVSQCAGDLLMAAFVGLNSLNNFVQETIEWKFGGFMCGWMPFVTTMCALLSSMVITCIAIDRYQGIILLAGKKDPNLFTAAMIIAAFWITAAGTAVPTFLNYTLKPACFINIEEYTSRYVHLCLTNMTLNSQYFVIVFTLIFLPLFIVFIVLNAVIARLLWRKKKEMQTQQNSGSASTLNTSLDSQSPPPVPKPSKSTNEQRKVRTFTIILIIMGTFIVCRLPQWIFIVVTSFPKHSISGNFVWTLKYLLSALSLANTAINPFIYPFLNDLVHLKSNITSGFKNLKNLKLKNIRANLISSSGK